MDTDAGRPMPAIGLFEELRDLHLQAWQSPHELHELANDHDGDPNEVLNNHGVRPLHLAAISPMPRAMDGVTGLMAAGADPNLTDALGAPPVFWAVRWASADITSVLIRETSDVAQLRDRWKRTIAHWWAIGPVDEGEGTQLALRDAGVEFNHLDDLGSAPIHWAAALGGRVDRLLAKEPHLVHQPDRRGFQPMHYAASAGVTMATCKALIRRGADVEGLVGQFRPVDLVPDSMRADWESLLTDSVVPGRRRHHEAGDRGTRHCPCMRCRAPGNGCLADHPAGARAVPPRATPPLQDDPGAELQGHPSVHPVLRLRSPEVNAPW